MPKKNLYNPTSEVYTELDVAFDFFNTELFSGKLNHCLITLQREKRTFGYFSKARFVRSHDEHEFTDEIALNPGYFAVRHIEETLATLVHEMAHMYQLYFGTPGRRGYHNKEWSGIMMELGLFPTNNGLPTGMQTGESVSHVIIEGGKFDLVCQKLLGTEFRISWLDRYPPVDRIQPLKKFTEADLAVTKPKVISSLTHEYNGYEDEDELDNIIPVDFTLPSSSSSQPFSTAFIEEDLPEYLILPRIDRSLRTKYQCSGCGISVWGKPGLRISCINCDLPLGITKAKRFMTQDV